MAVQGSQALCLPRFNLLDSRTGFSSAALVTQTNGICSIIVQTKNSTKPTALWREHNFGVAGQTVQYLLKLRASLSKKDVERNTITHHPWSRLLCPKCTPANSANESLLFFVAGAIVFRLVTTLEAYLPTRGIEPPPKVCPPPSNYSTGTPSANETLRVVHRCHKRSTVRCLKEAAHQVSSAVAKISLLSQVVGHRLEIVHLPVHCSSRLRD